MAELLGGLAGSLQNYLGGLISSVQAFVDKYLPPERRAELWERLQKFMTEKPMLAVSPRHYPPQVSPLTAQSFLLSHIAISGIPLGLFVLMTITVGVFALVAGLLIALLGALVFTVFCLGIALIILLPTLFFTTMVATFLFLWGVGAYYLLKWFNQKEIPGIHKPISSAFDGITGSQNEQLGALNPSMANANTGQESKQAQGGKQGQEGKQGQQGKGNNEGKKENEANGSAGDAELLSKVNKATGVDVKSVGDMKKKLNVTDVGELRKKASVGGVQDLKKELEVA